MASTRIRAAHDEIYDVLRTKPGLFALSKSRVRHLERDRGKWTAVWKGASFGFAGAYTVAVDDALYVIRNSPDSAPRSRTAPKSEILRLDDNNVTTTVISFDGSVNGAVAAGSAIYITLYKSRGSRYSPSDKIFRRQNGTPTPLRSPGGELNSVINFEGQPLRKRVEWLLPARRRSLGSRRRLRRYRVYVVERTTGRRDAAWRSYSARMPFGGQKMPSRRRSHASTGRVRQVGAKTDISL